MNWDEFYDTVIEGQLGIWKISKDEDKNIMLFDTARNFTWMMERRWEINSYNSLKINPHGDILMAGLGIGYEAFILKDNLDVNSITIIEKEENIINLTTKYLKHKKIKVRHDTIFKYMISTKDKYDLVYFDIFQETPAETHFIDETRILKIEAKKILKPSGRIHFWNKFMPVEL